MDINMIERISYHDVLHMIDCDSRKATNPIMSVFFDVWHQEKIISSKNWNNLSKSEKSKIAFYRYKSFFFVCRNEIEKLPNDKVEIFIENEQDKFEEYTISDYDFFNAIYSSVLAYKYSVNYVSGYSKNSLNWSKNFCVSFCDFLSLYENGEIVKKMSNAISENKICFVQKRIADFSEDEGDKQFSNIKDAIKDYIRNSF